MRKRLRDIEWGLIIGYTLGAIVIAALIIGAYAFSIWREYMFMIRVYGWSVNTARTISTIETIFIVLVIGFGGWAFLSEL